VNLVKSAFQAVSATRQARVFAEAALDAEQKKFDTARARVTWWLQYQRDLTQRGRRNPRAGHLQPSDLNPAFRQGTPLRDAKIDLEPIR